MPVRIKAIGLTMLAVVLLHNIAERTFASPKQQSLSLLRDRTGVGIHTKAASNLLNRRPLLPGEAKIVSSVSDAGKAGDWAAVMKLMAEYTGNANPVYNAALTAAYRCQRYSEGTNMYNRMCELGVNKTLPTYTMSMKLFAKVNDASTVASIWDEAVKTYTPDLPLYGARIDAYAEEGDVEGAVVILDLMYRDALEPSAISFGSAINACSKACRHQSAQFLLDKMLEARLKPDIVQITNLVKAHSSAPLQDLESVRSQMVELGIRVNRVFLEIYVVAALGKPVGRDTMKHVMDGAGEARLRHVADVISEAEADGVQLTGLVQHVKRALYK